MLIASAVYASPLFNALANVIHDITHFNEIASGNFPRPIIPASNEITRLMNSTVKMVGAVYCNNTYMESKSCRLCKAAEFKGLSFVKRTFFEPLDMAWFTAVDQESGTLVISFKGTSAKSNWQTNREAKLEPLDPLNRKGPLVHHGWHKTFLRARVLFEQSVIRSYNAYSDARVGFKISEPPKVWLTGHSAGGCTLVLI